MKEIRPYINRELSWLKFNERVLEEAENEKVPLCERLNFVSIFQSNLDEFFMVRIGSLTDQKFFSEKLRDNKTGMTAEEQIRAVQKNVLQLNHRKDVVYAQLMRRLEEYDIRLIGFNKLNDHEKQALESYFDHEAAPVISPTIVSRRQPFPFLNNKEICAAAVMTGKNGQERLGIIPCSTGIIPRLIEVPGRSGSFILSEELILHFLPKVFRGYQVTSKSLIRLTRNADIDSDSLYDEDLDYRDFMEKIIRKRKRQAPVRIELSREMDTDIVDTICAYTNTDPQSVFRCSSPLDMGFIGTIRDKLRQHSELFYEKRFPQRSASFVQGRSVFSQIKEKDRLLSYPFESMKPFMDFLQEAANDPAVVSIKMTLYRVAHQSKIVESLIEAAENGKNVLVLVELKARFDEENNIEWSRRLEAAGCQVIYGLDGYKVHSKLCLVTRRNKGMTEYYTQVGTGNYNENTARLYTDLSLMTADKGIGLEAAAVFSALSKGEVVEASEKLLVAPKCLQNRVLDLIDREIECVKNGETGYIGIKINSLTDKTIIDRLIEASEAGVRIDLVVRGICCLLPGIAGVTDNIRVISIVGRFLEHSRIYIFGTGERQKVYIASADFMTRNTLRRVEVAASVLDPDIRYRLTEMFRIMLLDNRQARELLPSGEYIHVHNCSEALNSQEYFYQEAYNAAAGIPEVSDSTSRSESWQSRLGRLKQLLFAARS
ncbi:MAG: polyphosphate kinase 1 [Eubacteriales bacterium]|nr:polyphosphate kinase 1 [Eubacteriales bacterium]